MPVRQQGSTARARSAVLAGAGVAGLAALVVTAPLADAAPTPAGPNVAPDVTTDTPTTAAPSEDVALPNYGSKKIRIGVQQKDGSYVPPTSTTVGTKITITETNPEFTEPSVTHCVTGADTRLDSDAASASFCDFRGDDRVAAKAKRQARAITKPVDGINTPFFQSYFITPGSTVAIEQSSVNPGYVIDPASPLTLEPCENPLPDARAAAVAPSCDSEQVILEDAGLPPVTTDDSAKTKEGVAVNIAIAPNDTPKAPIEGVKIVAAPKHGTAKLVTAESADPTPAPTESESTSEPAPSTSTITFERKAAGSRSFAAVTSYRAIYTPADGFTGVDTFDYTIATANGTATATVTVTVTGTAAAASDTAGSGAAADANDVAETGAPSGQLIGYGVALIAAGGGALALGAQRRRGRHAR